MTISSENSLTVLGTYSPVATYNLSKTHLSSKKSFVRVKGYCRWRHWNMQTVIYYGKQCINGCTTIWESRYPTIEDHSACSWQPQGIRSPCGLLRSIQPTNWNLMGDSKWWFNSNRTEILIRSQLSPGSRQRGPHTLTTIAFAMDRGYCFVSLLFDFFIPSRAIILGTVKHYPMFPHTHDQKWVRIIWGNMLIKSIQCTLHTMMDREDWHLGLLPLSRHAAGIKHQQYFLQKREQIGFYKHLKLKIA